MRCPSTTSPMKLQYLIGRLWLLILRRHCISFYGYLFREDWHQAKGQHEIRLVRVYRRSTSRKKYRGARTFSAGGRCSAGIMDVLPAPAPLASSPTLQMGLPRRPIWTPWKWNMLSVRPTSQEYLGTHNVLLEFKRYHFDIV